MSNFIETFLIKLPLEEIETSKLFAELFSQMHQILAESSLSFEIVTLGQSTGFYFTVDSDLAPIVSSKIYAIVPNAEIVKIEADDFGIKQTDYYESVEIKLGQNRLYPLKFYHEIEGDTLASLLNVLSQCQLEQKFGYSL